jgi:hypothetical protein
MRSAGAFATERSGWMEPPCKRPRCGRHPCTRPRRGRHRGEESDADARRPARETRATEGRRAEKYIPFLPRMRWGESKLTVGRMGAPEASGAARAYIRKHLWGQTPRCRGIRGGRAVSCSGWPRLGVRPRAGWLADANRRLSVQHRRRRVREVRCCRLTRRALRTVHVGSPHVAYDSVTALANSNRGSALRQSDEGGGVP